MKGGWRLSVVAGLILSLAVAAGCARQKPGTTSAAARGQALFGQLGCNACHSTDGTPMTGPTLKGLYGSEVKLVGGGTVKADEAYLRESITDPDAKTVEGFSTGVMSATISQERVRQGTNVDDLISYIKTLR